jgi:uncharacterized protein YndB with AHSA1/START domain
MLAFTWNAPPSIPELRDAGAKTHVILRFFDAGEGKTKLHLTQVGIGNGEAWDKYHAYFDGAWPKFLGWMQEYAAKAERPTKDAPPPSNLNGLSTQAIVNAPVADAWKALTTKEGLESWMAAHARVDLKVGGKMVATSVKSATLGDESTIENTYLTVVPERLIVIHCTKTPANFPFKNAIASVWSIIYFDPINEKQTRVRCTSLNFGSDEEARKCRDHFDKGSAWTIKKLQERLDKDNASK